jgi:hypothetical protein
MVNTRKKKVDAYCSACRIDQPHQVLTESASQPLLVKCSACDMEGPYMAPRDRVKAALKQVVERKQVDRERERLRGKLVELNSKGKLNKQVWEELTEDRDADEATEYAMSASLEALELVEHPKFGLGVVVERTEERKVCILFEDRPRLMVCGPAAADPV